MCNNQATKESLNNFRLFRNYYWGEDRIKLQTEGGPKCSTLDLTPTYATLAELNYRSIETLIIRDEYGAAYNKVVETINERPNHRVVFIFTGQPGIGM